MSPTFPLPPAPPGTTTPDVPGPAASATAIKAIMVKRAEARIETLAEKRVALTPPPVTG